MRSLRRIGARAFLRGAVEAGVIGLILLAPLPFGSVQPLAVFAVTATAGVLALLALPWWPHPALGAPLRIAAVASVFAIGLLQVVPLPAAALRVLSPTVVRLRETVPGGGFSGWSSLSVHPGATLEYLARLVAFASIFLVAASVASHGTAYRRILAAIFAAGIFQAAYGSIEYLSGHQHIFAYAKKYYLDAATGTYINQNHFAGALEMAFLVGLGFLLTRLRNHVPERRGATWRQRIVALFEGERARTLALTVTLAIVGLGLVLSYSRSGIVFGTLSVLLVLGLNLRLRGERGRALSVVLIGGAVLGGVLALVTLVGWERVASDLGRQMGGFTLETGRARVWLDSLGIVREFPLFGTGWGTFNDIYPLYRHEPTRLIYDYAHNDYLQALVETGIAGALAALCVLVAYWRIVLRGLVKYERRDLPLLFGAAGGLVSILAHEMSDFNLQIPANAVLFACLAGTLAGALATRRAAEAPDVIVFQHEARRRRRA